VRPLPFDSDLLLEEFSMTNDHPLREPNQIRQDCARKLSVVQVSDHFQAILGCLLGEDWTSPRLVEMVVTSEVTCLVDTMVMLNSTHS
jgi:hypothetical protein